MCFELSTNPARPVQETPAGVVARERWAVLSGDSFDLVARREGTSDIPIRLSRESAGSLTWTGQTVFPKAGEWKLRVAIAVPENHYPCFEKAVTVVATKEESAPVETAPGAGMAIIALGVVALALALTRARRERR